MTRPSPEPLVLENRHTEERLELRRIAKGGEVWLELRGSLPPHREGPPLHIHFLEDEGGRVTSGTLSAVVDGQRIDAGPGESSAFPKGSAHRWWNEGDEVLVFEGWARPVVDLDRYLDAVFEVVNAGPAGRPSLFYMSHLALRHRKTQAVLFMPRSIQAVLFPAVVLLGDHPRPVSGYRLAGLPHPMYGGTGGPSRRCLKELKLPTSGCHDFFIHGRIVHPAIPRQGFW